MNDPRTENSNSPSLGLLLIGIAVFALIFSGQIEESGLGRNSDPGPRAFPIGLSIFLILCGVYELISYLLRPRDSSRPSLQSLSESFQKAFSSGGELRSVLTLIVLMAIYIPAISWLGFSSSTFIFAAVLLKWLGTRLWVAIGLAGCATLVIQILFVSAFKVQLPEGMLGLPF